MIGNFLNIVSNYLTISDNFFLDFILFAIIGKIAFLTAWDKTGELCGESSALIMKFVHAFIRLGVFIVLFALLKLLFFLM